MTGNGVHARVAAFAAEAERLVASARDGPHAQPLARAASIYARLGETGRAGAAVEAAASSAMADALPYFQVINLVLVAEAYARLGRIRAAEGCTRQADGLIRAVEDPDWHGQAEAMVAGAMARNGAQRRAERHARVIAAPSARVTALLYIAEACPADAARLVDEAVPATRSITEGVPLVRMLTLVAEAMARYGRYAEAWRLAEEAEKAVADIEPRCQPAAYAQVAVAFARADRPALALSLARRAEEFTTGLDDEGWRQFAMVGVVKAYAHGGDPDGAERRARGLTERYTRACALSDLAVALATTDLDGAERITRTIDDKEWYVRVYALLRAAEAMLDAAERDAISRG